tara:strand:- start:228 stop:3476 length:3249 start_codon:yes stop_codon:yes gene_type:complete
MEHKYYITNVNYYKSILNKILNNVEFYNYTNLINNSNYISCYETIVNLIEFITTHIEKDNINNDNDIEYIENNIIFLIKNYGINDFDVFIKHCLDNKYFDNNNNTYNNDKLNIIKKHLKIVNYKTIEWFNGFDKNKNSKLKQKNTLIDDEKILTESSNFDCIDLCRTSSNYCLKIYGIKLIIHDYNKKITYVINTMCDNYLKDTVEDTQNSNYINNKIKDLNTYYKNYNYEDKNQKNNIINENRIFENYVSSLSLKELLIYDTEELYKRFKYIIEKNKTIEKDTINNIIKEFLSCDLYGQRKLLMCLLIDSENSQYMYTAYLLYDLLSVSTEYSHDSFEQRLLFSSLPWFYKKNFKYAMTKTIDYTLKLSNIDSNKIPLEQQICLLKTSEYVKEKAMQKLKEIKSKSEDSSGKARQYLDGLLNIPFGVYKEEFIFKIKYKNNIDYKNLILILIQNKVSDLDSYLKFDFDKNISNLEIINNTKKINEYYENFKNNLLTVILKNIKNTKKNKKYILNAIYEIISSNINSPIKNISKTSTSSLLINYIEENINNIDNINDAITINNLLDNNSFNNRYIIEINKYINNINNNNICINNYLKNVSNILDNSIYGHDNAKNQIQRIIGQWINGENSGYCFGFEGPPGTGKTSIAKKGISKCLLDNNNVSRPFAFIALGGSSNGSLLDGHNYTYVGSTWGKIVDVLMSTKCMNPIIFIDELDKVSKTEQGKEIIGILTHLTDSTQNSSFQDKYFNNIDIDLSKVLFIFSYNDVTLIDKILLDRIHRVKFDNLTLDEKLVIVKKFLLPEISKKFGLSNLIYIEDEDIKYIIEQYTLEPGVRKLKELIFEIVSYINLNLLKNNKYELPITLNIQTINQILIEHHVVSKISINNIHKIGVINGLWANSYGNSGILHIETDFFVTSNLLELKLTGMQGDVMKESMNVAKTLAWSLLEKKHRESLIKDFSKSKLQGIHIHVPEGATPKDGPSAGTAITTVIYSLLSNKQIKNNYAITGEINLQGKVTQIGSLDLKILGGIRAGVKNFIYPKSNNQDFKKFIHKYKDSIEIKEIINSIKFIEVETIDEVLENIIA